MANEKAKAQIENPCPLVRSCSLELRSEVKNLAKVGWKTALKRVIAPYLARFWRTIKNKESGSLGLLP